LNGGVFYEEKKYSGLRETKKGIAIYGNRKLKKYAFPFRNAFMKLAVVISKHLKKGENFDVPMGEWGFYLTLY